ncbi:EamA family transporter [Oscillatoria amoena NRMC-F 0135]|jgi:drug/metabolite transporter (DMT)-like permease|nr:EamA family transporter [Oscillatoria amoena NRMC-F 0135]
MSESTKGTAVVLLIVCSLIWGTSFILIKQGLKVFDPDEVGAMRVSAAALFLLPAALLKLRELKATHLPKLLLSGLMGIFIPAFLFSVAQTRMDSSIAGILNTLTPIFTMIIGAMLFQQRFRVLAVVGIVLGFAGTFMLMLSRSGGKVEGINLYALLIVVACILYGSNLNFIKFKIADVGSLAITSVSLLLIGPLAMLYLFFFTDFTAKFSTHEGAWPAFGYIVLLGMMSTAIATFLFNRLVKISTPLFASSVTYVMPIVAVMWGVLDGERLYLGHYIGMAAILGGVYLANRKKG